MNLAARSRALPFVLATSAVMACSVACSGGQVPTTGAGYGPTCTPLPTEPVVLEGKAASFDLTGVADLIGSTTQDGYILISARTEGNTTDLVTEFQAVVTDAGFDLAGSDNEGFEAEVFFARGNVAAGQVVLTRSPCPGAFDVTISVLDDPAVFPAETSVPS